MLLLSHNKGLLSTIADWVHLTDAGRGYTGGAAMTAPRKTPRNSKAMRLAVLVVVAVAVWFVVFR